MQCFKCLLARVGSSARLLWACVGTRSRKFSVSFWSQQGRQESNGLTGSDTWMCAEMWRDHTLLPRYRARQQGQGRAPNRPSTQICTRSHRLIGSVVLLDAIMVQPSCRAARSHDVRCLSTRLWYPEGPTETTGAGLVMGWEYNGARVHGG